MKAYRLVLAAIVFMSTSLVMVSGCKYNVTTPLWNQPYKGFPTDSITSVDPPMALAGVNTITIRGHNFIIAAQDTFASDTTLVYFSTGSVARKNYSLVQADVISIDSTAIVVRRPNLVSDSVTIKVQPHNGVIASTHAPYKITGVTSQYGGFVQGLQIGGIAVDGQDHVFVTEYIALLVHEATSAIDNSVLSYGGVSDAVSGTPLGASLGPDGNLYIITGVGKTIDKVILSSSTSSDSIKQKWVSFSKYVKYGDFSKGGYLFVGGTRTDLLVVPPWASGALTAAQMAAAGLYASDTILAVRVYGGDIYVASALAGSAGTEKIWKSHLNNDSTSANSRELVLDMGTTRFASDHITGITFSESGDMYISTNSTDPLLVDPGAGSDGSKVDNFYKGILPPYCSGVAWNGSSDYLYMTTGNGSSAYPYTVYRVDMGETGGKR